MPTLQEIIESSELDRKNRRVNQNNLPVLFNPENGLQRINNETQLDTLALLNKNLELLNKNFELQNKERTSAKPKSISRGSNQDTSVSEDNNRNNKRERERTEQRKKDELAEKKLEVKLSNFFLKSTKSGSVGNTAREGSSALILSALGLGGVDNVFGLSKKFGNADFSLQSFKDKYRKGKEGYEDLRGRFSNSTSRPNDSVQVNTPIRTSIPVSNLPVPVVPNNRFNETDNDTRENETEDENRRQRENTAFETFRQNAQKKDDSIILPLVAAVLGGIALIGGFITEKLSSVFSLLKSSYSVVENVITGLGKGLLKTFESIGSVFNLVKNKIVNIPDLIKEEFKIIPKMFNTVGEWLGKGKDFFSGAKATATNFFKGTFSKAGEVASKVGSKVFDFGSKTFEGAKGLGKYALKLPGVQTGLNIGKKLGGLPLQTLDNLGNMLYGQMNAGSILGMKEQNVSTQDRYLAGGLQAGTNLLNIPNSLSFGYIPKTVDSPMDLQNKVSSGLDEFMGNYDTPETRYGNEKSFPSTLSPEASKLSDIAMNRTINNKKTGFQNKNIQNVLNGAGTCYATVWSDIVKSGLNSKGLNPKGTFTGEYAQANAVDFSYWAETNEGKQNVSRVAMNKNDKMLGLLPGDIIVFDQGWYVGNKAGHIEIVGKDGSGYSDFKDTDLNLVKSNINKIRGVYRYNSKSVAKTKKPDNKKNIKTVTITKPINLTGGGDISSLGNSGGEGNSSDLINTKISNLDTNISIPNMENNIDKSSSGSREVNIPSVNKGIEDVKENTPRHENISESLKGFSENQSNFNNGLINMLPSIMQSQNSNNQSSSLPMSSTFAGDDPFFAIIQSWL